MIREEEEESLRRRCHVCVGGKKMATLIDHALFSSSLCFVFLLWLHRLSKSVVLPLPKSLCLWLRLAFGWRGY